MRTPFYHFSVDDVFDSFIEVSDRKIPLFEHPFFQFLKQVHDEFGTNIHLYLFYRKKLNGKMRTLADVSDSIRNSFRENHWLRLGPHALDHDTPPYTQSLEEQIEAFDSIYSEIGRLAGNRGMTKWVRLHYFSESYELAEYFKAKGVEALLSTDRETISYRLPVYVRARLKKEGAVNYGGVTFIRSHLRVETLARDRFTENHVHEVIESLLTRLGGAVVLTHECELARPEVRAMAVSVLHYLKDRNVGSF